MASLADLIEEADQAQQDNGGGYAYDLTIAIEGGQKFMGHVSLDPMSETVAIWSRLDNALGGRPANIVVSEARDGGTSDVPVHIPLSRVLYAHYSSREI